MIQALDSPIAFVAVGIPGSGKTAYCKQLARELGAIYVSRAIIRRYLAGQVSGHGLDLAVERRYRLLIAAALRSGRHVVVVADNASRSQRGSIVGHCRRHGALQVVGYWFDMPLAAALSRQLPPQEEPLLKRLWWYLKTDPPSAADGFDELIKVAARTAVPTQP